MTKTFEEIDEEANDCEEYNEIIQKITSLFYDD